MLYRIRLSCLLMSLILLQSCLKDDQKTVGIPNPVISIELLRQIHKGSDLKLNRENLAGATKVSGVVIGRYDDRNLPENYLIIQNTSRGRTRGIILNFPKEIVQQYQYGDSLIIDLEQATLTTKEGPMIIDGVQAAAIQKIDLNRVPLVRAVSVATLLQRFNEYESTLININANLANENELGQPFAGKTQLSDGTGVIDLYVDGLSAIASESRPSNASYRGIPLTMTAGDKVLRVPRIVDIIDPSGPIYPNWPEDFEFPDQTVKPSYNMTAINNMVELKTGWWQMYQVILSNTAGRDLIISGKQATRFQQNLGVEPLLQMDFDVPNGASKVTLWYSSYYNDASCTWSLDASTDQGATWQEIGEPISDASPFSNGQQFASFSVDFQGPVRFRVRKHGLGQTLEPHVRNGRLTIDDISIYQNY